MNNGSLGLSTSRLPLPRPCPTTPNSSPQPPSKDRTPETFSKDLFQYDLRPFYSFLIVLSVTLPSALHDTVVPVSPPSVALCKFFTCNKECRPRFDRSPHLRTEILRVVGGLMDRSRPGSSRRLLKYRSLNSLFLCCFVSRYTCTSMRPASYK